MKLSQPRISPLEEPDWTEEEREILKRASLTEIPPNIFKTLVRHKKLLKRWMVFATHILNKNSLPLRDRELVILRIGYLCQSGYEWAQHVVIGKQAGITDQEIDWIRQGPEATKWSDFDRALMRATDELHTDAFISDTTWSDLKKKYSDDQMMDLVFTIGNYNLVSMALNTLGVQLEDEIKDIRL